MILRIVGEYPDGSYVATYDGGPALRTWHTEEILEEEWETMSPVFYEVHNFAGGRTAHGYLHPVSRKIVQTG